MYEKRDVIEEESKIWLNVYRPREVYRDEKIGINNGYIDCIGYSSTKRISPCLAWILRVRIRCTPSVAAAPSSLLLWRIQRVAQLRWTGLLRSGVGPGILGAKVDSLWLAERLGSWLLAIEPLSARE